MVKDPAERGRLEEVETFLENLKLEPYYIPKAKDYRYIHLGRCRK